jgi:protein-S-isoprenylcysteine O-methyltransferase Ste14
MVRINKSFLVHTVLGHSYLVYFASLILGMLIDLKWALHFDLPALIPLGYALLFLGPALIIWAQHTSNVLAARQLIEQKDTRTHDFFKGPYMFTRSPTHLGLFTMIIGLGFIFNSFAIVSTTLLAFVLTKIFFLRKEEELLSEKYGQEYEDYKAKVQL